MALWGTVIGKKVVMAVTGLFLSACDWSRARLSQDFRRPRRIDAYSRVLRKVGEPELGDGDAV
jgi:hypothetical protein